MPRGTRQQEPGDARSPARQPFCLESFRRPGSMPTHKANTSSSTRGTPARTGSRWNHSAVSHESRVASVRKEESVISRIESNASRVIRAAHTILDPAAIIKELVENALDARPTRVHIRVRGKGAVESLTVSDDGHGIAHADFDALCLASTTSKIASFDDLEKLDTFGFRGEALSAICAICNSTTVTTRSKGDPIATVLRYGKDGSVASRDATARPVGTTVQVEGVFHSFPVRQKDAIKNHAREISRCVAAVQALALISVNTRIELKIGSELKVANLPAMPNARAIPSSLGRVSLSALRHNAKSVLGARTADALSEVSWDDLATVTIPPNARSPTMVEGTMVTADKAAYGCHGLISKACLDVNGFGGRAKSSHQYVFINRRPVDFPRLIRSVKELYRSATGLNGAAPVVILNLVLPPWSCDVNLAPDKRVVCVHEESTLISGLLAALENIWVPKKESTIPVQQDSNLRHLLKDRANANPEAFSYERRGQNPNMGEASDGERVAPSPSHDSSVPAAVHPESSKEVIDVCQPATIDAGPPIHAVDEAPHLGEASQGRKLIRPVEESGSVLESESLTTPPNAAASLSPVDKESLIEDSTKSVKEDKSSPHHRSKRARDSLISSAANNSTARNVGSFIARRALSHVSPKRPRPARPAERDSEAGLFREIAKEPLRRSESPRQEGEPEELEVVENMPVTLDEPTEGPSVRSPSAEVSVDWEAVCNGFRIALPERGNMPNSPATALDGPAKLDAFIDATVEGLDRKIIDDAQNKAAETEMSRLFRQEWFNDLEVIGQFNRGFIIARLRNDLFIIDQHASDEKHNFEDLQRNTVISKQRLVQPLGLEFSAQDEVLVLQHLDAFRAGGFDIVYREQNSPTKRLFLTAQPISKHTIFVQDDLRDIVDMLKSSIVQSSSMKIKMLRPPRVRSMFASRACRKSVMIGTALRRAQMRKIVRNLAVLEHPWTCPHGRPTMRHLCSVPGEFVD